MRLRRSTLWIIAMACAAILLSGCAPTQPNPTSGGGQPTQASAGPKTTHPAPTLASETQTLPGQVTPAGAYPQATNTTFPTQTTSATNEKLLAYVGSDGNLWLSTPNGSQKKPITQGATEYRPGSAEEGVVFSDPIFSSDGKYLVYTRRIDRTAEAGIASQYSVIRYEVSSGHAQMVFENQQVSGYSWRPDSYLLAYSLPTDAQYFTGPGEAESKLAIWEIDTQTGSTQEIVAPMRGFHLYRPQWSPLGDRLTFQEIRQLEGQGNFAFFDFKTGKYIAWDRPIGAYSWSLDEKQIIYDTISYAPVPGNQIWSDDGLGLNEVALTEKDESAVVMYPIFAPKGDQFVYLKQKIDPPDAEYEIYIRSAKPGSQASLLGSFPQAGDLRWSPDGKYLSLAYGAYPQQKIAILPITGEKAQLLDAGSQPVWQP